MVVLGNATFMKSPVSEHSEDHPSSSSAIIRVDEQNHYDEDWIPPFDFRDGVRIKTNEKFGDYYELYEEIGEGKFGKVFRCVEKSTKLILAAKRIQLKRDADIQKVEKEVTIMTQMKHKCIAQIYDAFATSSNEIILIMEIVEGGELFDRVVDESYILTEMAVAMIVYQICEAIRYIHSQNIIHLDLKPENIMCISQTGNQIKLIDFGLAQYFDGQRDLLFMAGTPEFAAPEVIKYEPLDFHTDILSGQSPFLGDNIAVTYCNVERGKWEFCEEFNENYISKEAKDFISKLLVVNKGDRMLPNDCLIHTWMLKSMEKARKSMLSNKVIEERQLSVTKLRSYVRNKRFRRLVFGVLFVNTVVRMLNTLSERKSHHGIEYVKKMLNAVENRQSMNENDVDSKEVAAASFMKSLFFSKRRLEKGTEPTNAKDDTKNEQESKVNSEKTSRRRTTSSGEELHKKPKRLNIKQQKIPIESSDPGTSSGGGGPSIEAKPKRRVKALKTRTASSTEQVLKKPKTEVNENGKENKTIEPVFLKLLKAEASTDSETSKVGETKKKVNSRPNSPSKLQFLSKFEDNCTEASFTLPVACAIPILKPRSIEKPAIVEKKIETTISPQPSTSLEPKKSPSRPSSPTNNDTKTPINRPISPTKNLENKKPETRPNSPSKLQFLSKFENSAGESPLKLPVAGATTNSAKPKLVTEAPKPEKFLNIPTVIISEPEPEAPKKKRVLRKQVKAVETGSDTDGAIKTESPPKASETKEKDIKKVEDKKVPNPPKATVSEKEMGTSVSMVSQRLKQLEDKNTTSFVMPIAVSSVLPVPITSTEQSLKDESIKIKKIQDSTASTKPVNTDSASKIDPKSSLTSKNLALNLESRSENEDSIRIRQTYKKQETEIHSSKNSTEQKDIKKLKKISTKNYIEVSSRISRQSESSAANSSKDDSARRRSKSVASGVLAVSTKLSSKTNEEIGKIQQESKSKSKTDLSIRKQMFENDLIPVFNGNLNLLEKKEKLKKTVKVAEQETFKLEESKNTNKLNASINGEIESTTIMLRKTTKVDSQDKLKEKIKEKVTFKISYIQFV